MPGKLPLLQRPVRFAHRPQARRVFAVAIEWTEKVALQLSKILGLEPQVGEHENHFHDPLVLRPAMLLLESSPLPVGGELVDLPPPTLAPVAFQKAASSNAIRDCLPDRMAASRLAVCGSRRRIKKRPVASLAA